MTAERFTVDSEGKYWDTVSKKYVTIDHLFYLVEKLEKENEELSVMKLKGLKVLEFYEDKLKNADRKEFENAREELWIVKEVLCEMGVIKDE